MTRAVNLIGFACGLGAKKRTCDQGPGKLLYFNLHEKLQEHHIDATWLPLYHHIDESVLPITSALRDYILHLQTQVGQTIKAHRFPITLGGDHSMALGTWTEIIRHHQLYQRFGLIWIDAHLDAHTIHTTHTHAYHGMPVSYLLGYGEDDISQTLPHKALLSPKHLVLIGVRSYEKEEQLLLNRLGVKIYYMEDVLTKGIDTVMSEAIAYVSSQTDAFGVSIDLDAFDPHVAPGTGSLENGGLTKDETLAALTRLKNQPKLYGLEIAEFNPSLDKQNQTAILIQSIILSVMS